jgi:hypothetical protein
VLTVNPDISAKNTAPVAVSIKAATNMIGIKIFLLKFNFLAILIFLMPLIILKIMQ